MFLGLSFRARGRFGGAAELTALKTGPSNELALCLSSSGHLQDELSHIRGPLWWLADSRASPWRAETQDSGAASRDIQPNHGPQTHFSPTRGNIATECGALAMTCISASLDPLSRDIQSHSNTLPTEPTGRTLML